MQTFAVLNPVARIDQHIMDDSDLAGPILFFLLFGFFLLFVRLPYDIEGIRASRDLRSMSDPFADNNMTI